jgi:hypothetical protein
VIFNVSVPPEGRGYILLSGLVPISGGSGSDVAVGVAVPVAVSVGVAVPVPVEEGVAVDVAVFAKVVGRVGTCVEVVVEMGAGLAVADRVGGRYTGVLVMLVDTMTVAATDETRVGKGDGVPRILGNGVPVTKEAPGVRKTFSQLG